MFHVTSFASAAIDIVDIMDTFTSTHAGTVIKRIKQFDPKGKTIPTRVICVVLGHGQVLHVLLLHVQDIYHSFLLSADHKDKTGTNIFAALYKVNEMMAIFKRNPDSHFDKTQSVIVLITDGKNHMNSNSMTDISLVFG